MEKEGIIDVQVLCVYIATQLGYCEKCGCVPHVIAVFENNESDEIIGFKIICDCNGKDTLTQEEMANLKTYTVEEVVEMLKSKGDF